MEKMVVRIGYPSFFLEYGGDLVRGSLETTSKKIDNGWRMWLEAQCLSDHPNANLDTSGRVRTKRIVKLVRKKGLWIASTPRVDYYYLTKD